MQDYFSEFLLNKNPIGAVASLLGEDAQVAAAAQTAIPVCGSNLKLHLIWGAVTVAIVFATWKISKWYAGYQFAKKQTTNQPSLPTNIA